MKYVLILFLLITGYGIFVIVRDMNRFVTVSYEIRSEKIKKKYTIVMLSDLHDKAYGKQNEKLIRAVEAIRPDSVMTVGDLYTSKTGSGFDNALALMKALAERFPVYAANGNHEHKTAENPETFHHMYERYMEKLEEYGVVTLVNSRLKLPQVNVNVCGLQIARGYFLHFGQKEMPRGYVESLVGPADSDSFQILLAHNPIYFSEYADWGADLVLSGHMHGGIVRLPFLGGVASPSIGLFPRYDGGRFCQKQSTMVLGRGLGTHSIPVRMWNPGELVVVTLLPQSV